MIKRRLTAKERKNMEKNTKPLSPPIPSSEKCQDNKKRKFRKKNRRT